MHAEAEKELVLASERRQKNTAIRRETHTQSDSYDVSHAKVTQNERLCEHQIEESQEVCRETQACV